MSPVMLILRPGIDSLEERSERSVGWNSCFQLRGMRGGFRVYAELLEMRRMSGEEDEGRLKGWCDGPPLSVLVFLVACARVGQDSPGTAETKQQI